ncbi:MAG: hypothetical protein NT150_09335 [Bacteroidetes bacterium]|nr:hypothetical protein [Bacteroidota bacterium]
MNITRLKLIIIAASTFAVSNAYSQSGAIYSFNFKVDPQLTEYYKVEKSGHLLSNYSQKDEMPQSLIDSIKINTEAAFAAKLNMPVQMCFHKYSSPMHFTSEGLNGVLEGLPEITTFKRGQKDCPQNTRYIKLDVLIFVGGGYFVVNETNKTKMRPQIQITAKVVDENKQEVWKGKVMLKDFEKLKTETILIDGGYVKNSEVLSPNQIYAMYMLALNKLMIE